MNEAGGIPFTDIRRILTMTKEMIDRKAFDDAWEEMGWDNQNPQATEAQERFVAAYEAAKPEIVWERRIDPLGVAFIALLMLGIYLEGKGIIP